MLGKNRKFSRIKIPWIYSFQNEKGNENVAHSILVTPYTGSLTNRGGLRDSRLPLVAGMTWKIGLVGMT